MCIIHYFCIEKKLYNLVLIIKSHLANLWVVVIFLFFATTLRLGRSCTPPVIPFFWTVRPAVLILCTAGPAAVWSTVLSGSWTVLVSCSSEDELPLSSELWMRNKFKRASYICETILHVVSISNGIFTSSLSTLQPIYACKMQTYNKDLNICYHCQYYWNF